MDFIHQVQMATVASGLSTADAALPLISVAAPFSRTADIPAGNVTIRDVAGLYIYDNTLYGKKLTGAQLKDYLEYAAKYYHQFASGTKVDTATLTNANNFWDYMYDTAAGVEYDIDIAQAEGSRIKNLTYKGVAIADDQVFVVAVNNYRANGGSGYPHIAAADIGVQLHQRDPPADDRLRHGQGHPRPGRLRGHQLEADAGRGRVHSQLTDSQKVLAPTKLVLQVLRRQRQNPGGGPRPSRPGPLRVRGRESPTAW